MREVKLMKPYPLWKLTYEQFPFGEEAKDVYTIEVKMAVHTNWFPLYRTYSSCWAEMALKKLQDMIYTLAPSIFDDENMPTMFEIYDQVYKTKYMFPDQSCIVGETISGNQRYGEFSVDAVKYDYVQSLVMFYDRGTCLVKGNQLFIDGDLLFTSSELKEKCDEIGQEFNQLDTYPDKLIKFIKENFPHAKSYVCNGYSAFGIQER